MQRKPQPERLDSESPEATPAWFLKARPAQEVLPDLMGADLARDMLQPKRGRPPSTCPKEHVNIRLDADILEAFKGGGAGWQTRINQALRDWLKTQPSTRKA